MIGDKTPRQIRTEIANAFAAMGEDVVVELDRMLRALKSESKSDKYEIQNLLLLRDALAKGAAAKRRQRRASTRAHSKSAR
jgi:hypothetical protein